jgi:7-cyano-7-deazaguanine synthase
MDCVASLAIAKSKGIDVKQAVFFDYGQRAARKEEAAAKKIADYYGLCFETITLDFLKNITKTSLVNTDANVPNPDIGQLDAILHMQQTASAVWVPNRNGIMVNILAGYADSFGYDQIIVGWNAEECTTFSDNTPQCATACTEALLYTTQQQPQVISYVQNMNKMEIVDKVVELGVPAELLWSCYHGGEGMCGECESCKRFARAFSATGHWDLVKNNFSTNSSIHAALAV